MTTLNSANPDRECSDQGLDRRYGKIGIPAVVAALRYRPDTKNRPSHSARDEQGRVPVRG
jgi:hypothetical protein